jgi:glycosyltransferase involved in cell wall biosynthesis
MKRVIYVDQTALMGGAEVALATLLAALDRTDWAPEVVLGQDGPLANRLRDAGIPVQVLPLPPLLHGPYEGAHRMADPRRWFRALTYAMVLAKHFRSRKADLVQPVSLRALVLAGIAARMAGVPTVWQVHSVVAEPMISRGGVMLLRNLARWVPSHIIFNSTATAACFDVSTGMATIIPIGIDGQRFSPNGDAPRTLTRVGMLARFTPLKGQHVFLEAVEEVASIHPEAQFLFAGTALFGEEEYERQVRARALSSPQHDKIRFLGFVDNAPEFIRHLDIVVHASELPEGFGQTIVEAMLAGKPVVATAAGGPKDIIEDGVTGLLVEPGDAKGLARAIDYLMTHPTEASAMATRARTCALERYDTTRFARSVEEVYSSVLAAAGHSESAWVPR